MLLAIREKVTGVIAVVFVCVIGAFMIVPMLYQYVAGLGDNSAVIVNDDKITLQQFQQQLSQNRERLAQAFGGNIPEYFNQGDFLNKQTIDYIVQDKLLDQLTLEDDYRLSPSTVKQLITEVPEFHKDGVFDQETYERQLNSIGRSKVGFEIEFAQQLAHAQLQDGLIKSAFVLDSELASIAELQHQKRDFEFIRLDTEAYREQQSVSDEEIASYHNENQAQFQHPEKASIEYVELNLDVFKAKVEVSDETLQQEYNAGIENGRYTTPEVRSARHILLKVAEDADEATVEAKRLEAVALVDRLKGGADFAELAKELSEDPGSAVQGGDLGEVRRGVMVPAFEEAVYAQVKDEIGDPVKTRFGFHIIRVDAVTEAVKKPFEDAKQEIRDDYVSNQAREAFNSALDEMTNLAFENPDSLDPIAEALSLESQTTGLFTRESGSGIAQESVIREATFRPEVLTEGNNSGTLEIKDGQVVVLRLDQYEPKRDKSLDEARAEVENILLTQKTNEALDKAQSEIETGLTEGKAIQALADEFKGTVESAEAVTRTDRKGFDANLVQAIFELAQNDEDQAAVTSANLVGGNRAVAVLRKVVNGDWTSLEQAEKDRLREQALGANGNGDFSSLLNAVRAEADIYVNPQLTSK